MNALKKALLLSLCVGMLISVDRFALAQDKPFTVETQFEPRLGLLPLPVHVPPGREIYHTALWGVRIIRVFADDVEIASKPWVGLFGCICDTKLTIDGDMYVYQLNLPNTGHGDAMQFVVGDIHTDGGYSATSFDVPKNVRNFEIHYTYEFGDGTPSGRQYIMRAVNPTLR